MKRKPIIGETLYSLNVGNKAGRGREQKLTPMIVHSVGRKYFTLKQGDWNIFVEFHIDAWRQKTEYCEDHKLYETEQEWLDEEESKKYCKVIYESFPYGMNSRNLSLRNLREICDIIENNS